MPLNFSSPIIRLYTIAVSIGTDISYAEIKNSQQSASPVFLCSLPFQIQPLTTDKLAIDYKIRDYVTQSARPHFNMHFS